MRLPGLHMSKELKQTFIGGIVAGLAYHMEEAAYELMPNYPPQLSQKLDPNLPRNGQILALGAPLAAAWAAPKLIKRHSAGIKNVRNGVTLFDAPALLHRFGVDMLANLGATARLGPTPGGNGSMIYRPMMNARPTMILPVPMSGTKYIAGNTPNYAGNSGVGRYRVGR